jgi:RNA polymerase sigma-70 factor (ECF subfamily)
MKSAGQSDPEEENLIRKASSGCLEAFNQLVLRYQHLAYHHAYILLGDVDSAEDVTQDSFIKAFQNIHRFRGGSFRAWLLRILTNTAYDHLRQVRRRPVLPLFTEDEDGEESESSTWFIDASASVEATVEQNEAARRVYQWLNGLPEIYRHVLILVDLYELNYGEVAEILSVPLGTVKSRLVRARLRMRKRLQDDGEYFAVYRRNNPLASV